MTYHRKAIMSLSALALAVSAAYALPPVGPGRDPIQETPGVVTAGPLFTANALNSVIVGTCVCSSGVVPCSLARPGKCTTGRVGFDCRTNADCNVYASIMDTGFEAPEWDNGVSVCGDEFALGVTCFYPITDVCIAKNHAANQNCCPEDPNEETGWSMSPSGRHCSQPAITDVNPSMGAQHIRFSYDPAGGSPAGCNGFASVCRERFITSQANLSGVSHTVYSYDIAFDGTLGMSLVNFMGQDTNQGSINLNTYMLWHYYGALYIYTWSASAFAYGGLWADTVPDYAKFTADLDPCNNVVTYYYDGVEVASEPYGFTPPYGDEAIDGYGSRKATTDSAFFTTDHYPPVNIDIDEHRVTHTPCSDACCDGNTGVCTDGAFEAECSGPNQHFYPNMPCSFLGTINAGTGEPYPEACGIVTGSCCDTGPGAGQDPGPDGFCQDGVTEAACLGSPVNPQRHWKQDGTCGNDIPAVLGVCHSGSGSCGPTAGQGCANFPYIGQSCATDADCTVQGFCYTGTCTPSPLFGSCVYPTKGFCQGMGSCLGEPPCDPSTGTNCCDNGCATPILCPSGIPTDCSGSAGCNAVPGGADCAFCEGCDGFPVVHCASVADCPPPLPGMPAGIDCVADPLFGCFSDADCGPGLPCLVSARNVGGKLCTSDADCGTTAVEQTICTETTGACCDIITGDCVSDQLRSDCPDGTVGTLNQHAWSKGLTCDDVDCDAILGACCDHDTFAGCNDTTSAGCPRSETGTQNKVTWTKGSLCAEITDCDHKAIPTVSEWGILVLTLLLLTGAKIYFGRRQAATA